MKMRKGHRRWTPEEEATLKARWLEMSAMGKNNVDCARKLCKLLGRTEKSILNKADQMHLTYSAARRGEEYNASTT